jgi:CubicO group peptidase (beta-lactamase class C family)
MFTRRAAAGLFGFGALAAAAGPAAAARRPRDPFAFAGPLIDQVRRDWSVPGMAVAVVQGDRVAYAQGFGVKAAGGEEPVTADTLFGAGSTTKAFTGAAAAMLAGEGALDLDAPVRALLPGFRMAGGAGHDGVSLRDMLCHRTGLPRHDLLWYNNGELTPAGLLERLPFLPVAAPLRARHLYNNIMYILAGHAIGVAAGASWEELTRARLLAPLGMTRTVFNPLDMARDPDFATGHYLDGARTAQRTVLQPDDRIGAAGALHSSVREYAQWARFQLGRGTFAGRTLLAREQAAALWEPLILTGGPPSEPALGRAFYGLGWRIDTYRGLLRVAHGGDLNGYASRITLFPERDLAIIAFANVGGSPAPGHASLDLADRLLGLEPLGWSARALERRARRDAEPPAPPQRLAGTSPSRPLSAFAGRYSHGGYGALLIEEAQGGLKATYNAMPATLAHWHYDVFNATPIRLEDGDLADMRFGFQSDLKGAVSGVAVEMEELVDPIVFARVG